ncbi:MAG: hypothetical protein R3F31_03675 [Verrucomicrobiales bacterium]
MAAAALCSRFGVVGHRRGQQRRGRRVITDSFANGVLYNEQQVRVGQSTTTAGGLSLKG